MSRSDTERTYVPAELDALEDAIELMPAGAAHLPSQLDADARARIHDALLRYRAIEALARSLLLQAEPPASVLADVFTQARAATVAARDVAVDARPAAPGVASISRRWMWWSLPPLAAIGPAAVVAVMGMRPHGDLASRPAESPAVIAQAVPLDLIAPLQPTGSAAPPALADASSMLAPLADGGGAGTLALEEPRAVESKPTQLAKVGALAAKRTRTPPSPAPSGGAAPGRDAPTKPVLLGDRLARADASRRGGDCAAARSDYDAVIAGGLAKQRGQARAGLSLCLERAGDGAGARVLAAKARIDDAGIDTWIAQER